MIAPGYEKHFDAGGDRLSPYVGFEIGYGVTSSSMEQEFWSADDENQVGDQDQYIVWTQTISQSASMFKLGLGSLVSTPTSRTTSTWVQKPASVS